MSLQFLYFFTFTVHVASTYALIISVSQVFSCLSGAPLSDIAQIFYLKINN